MPPDLRHRVEDFIASGKAGPGVVSQISESTGTKPGNEFPRVRGRKAPTQEPSMAEKYVLQFEAR